MSRRNFIGGSRRDLCYDITNKWNKGGNNLLRILKTSMHIENIKVIDCFNLVSRENIYETFHLSLYFCKNHILLIVNGLISSAFLRSHDSWLTIPVDRQRFTSQQNALTEVITTSDDKVLLSIHPPVVC